MIRKRPSLSSASKDCGALWLLASSIVRVECFMVVLPINYLFRF